jgi:hypothetical protein
MLFATPDFGAGGFILLIIVGIVLAVSAVSMLAIFRGIDMCLEEPRVRRWLGVASICLGIALPLCAFCGPSVLFRLQHATPPIDDVPSDLIQEGMSSEEVQARIGPPHEIESYNPSYVKWVYWRDAIRFESYSVFFDKTRGAVKGTSRS